MKQFLAFFTSSSIFSLIIMLIGCGSPIHPKPQSPSPQHQKWIKQARISFEQGDWHQLEKLLPSLKETALSFSQIHFYTGVVQGMKSPQKGALLLKKVEETATNLGLMEQAGLYRFIFLAQQKECLTALGPLESIYLPKSKQFAPSSRDQKL